MALRGPRDGTALLGLFGQPGEQGGVDARNVGLGYEVRPRDRESFRALVQRDPGLRRHLAGRVPGLGQGSGEGHGKASRVSGADELLGVRPGADRRTSRSNENGNSRAPPPGDMRPFPSVMVPCQTALDLRTNMFPPFRSYYTSRNTRLTGGPIAVIKRDLMPSFIMRIKLGLAILLLGLASRLGADPVVLSASGGGSAGLTPPDFGETRARWAAMESGVRKKVASFRGEVGLIIRDLATGWTLQVNPDDPFPAASMVKVPIMAACLEAQRDGLLSLEDRMTLKRSDKASGSGLLRRNRSGSVFTVDRLVELMVTHSDNTAANMLIDRLGFDYFNDAFRRMGLARTNLARKMMDFTSRSQGIENFTTAREMADILERMYRRDCLSAEVSGICLEILKGQRVNDRIPRLLPRDTVVAHKTGLERSVCHDAGIVFTERGDFLISVFTRTWSGKNYAKRLIAGLAALAYKVYGPETVKTAA